MSEIMRGFWRDISPHLQRNAVFMVAAELDLREVGDKVTKDDVESVEPWIQSRRLTRPTLLQIKAWDDEVAKEFNFMLIAPYVLIQELPH